MLETVLIQNFKGFKNTSIGPFRMVNLIIGGQNVGKTSLLEAVYAASEFDPFAAMSGFRKVEGNDATRYALAFSHPKFFLCALSDEGKGQAISAKDIGILPIERDAEFLSSVEWTKEKFHQLSFYSWAVGWSAKENTRPHLHSKAIAYSLPSQTQLVQLFGQVVLFRKKKELMDLLRKVDPRLESLDAIAPDGEQRIYAELEGHSQALPLNMLGHGFSRLVYIFAELLVSDANLALIDEVENGIHYNALPTLFHGIKAVAQERQVQSLITTHSWDCLRAACEVFEDTPDMFQVIRLERHGDDVKAVCIDGERMLRLMAEEREVR